MSEIPSPAAVLWTGGKDSSLALARAVDRGTHIAVLATFVPRGAVFKAHPIQAMRAQAADLGVPYATFEVREPYDTSYEAALKNIRDRYGVASVITGDIDLVDGKPNWIEERSRGLDLAVCRPLWKEDRERLLRELVAREIEARVTYIADEKLPAAWLGRTITADFIDDINRLAARTGIDLCGENGEYHTMVRDFGPLVTRIARAARASART